MAKVEQNIGLRQNADLDLSMDLGSSTLPSLDAPVHNYIESLPGKMVKYRVSGDPDVAGYDNTALPVNLGGKPVGYNFSSVSSAVTDTGIEFEERDANTTRLKINLSAVSKIAGGTETGQDLVSLTSRSNSIFIPRADNRGSTTIARAEEASYALSA